jgi:hypothetical protein
LAKPLSVIYSVVLSLTHSLTLPYYKCNPTGATSNICGSFKILSFVYTSIFTRNIAFKFKCHPKGDSPKINILQLPTSKNIPSLQGLSIIHSHFVIITYIVHLTSLERNLFSEIK